MPLCVFGLRAQTELSIFPHIFFSLDVGPRLNHDKCIAPEWVVIRISRASLCFRLKGAGRVKSLSPSIYSHSDQVFITINMAHKRVITSLSIHMNFFLLQAPANSSKKCLNCTAALNLALICQLNFVSCTQNFKICLNPPPPPPSVRVCSIVEYPHFHNYLDSSPKCTVNLKLCPERDDYTLSAP